MVTATPGVQSCCAPSARRLLLRYSLRRASDAEQREFEGHLLECDACYEDFVAVWRVTELAQEWRDDPGSLSNALPLVVNEGNVHSWLRPILWWAFGAAVGLSVGVLL